MNVVFIGDICIDHNVTEQATYTSWGSQLMYGGYYFRNQLGIDPLLITDYGPDFEIYRDNFRILPMLPNRDKTLVMENRVQLDHRTRRCFNVHEPHALNKTEIAAIADANLIIVGALLPHYLPRYLESALAQRQSHSLAVLLAQGYFCEPAADGKIVHGPFKQADAILPFFDMVVYSQDDDPRALEDAAQWSAQHDALFIVTQGSEGAAFAADGKTTHVATTPVPPEEIIDSVGCGDILGAAAAHHYCLHRDAVAAVRAGNVAARAKLLRSSASGFTPSSPATI